MVKCIICNKDIIGIDKVVLDKKYNAHLVCFYSLIPKAGNKIKGSVRIKKIMKIAKELIVRYDKENIIK